VNAAATVAALAAGVLAWVTLARSAAAGPPADPPADGILGLVIAINEHEFSGWFDPVDVMAIIDIESGFNPNAVRTEARLNDASRGLMQILLSTARDRGFSGDPARLLDPEINIRYGMRQLKWSWDYLYTRKGGALARDLWIGSYNAGVGNAMNGFTPLGYVQKFAAARARWQARIDV
jgi:soluble lytic murein transglycosylase-like protein